MGLKLTSSLFVCLFFVDLLLFKAITLLKGWQKRSTEKVKVPKIPKILWNHKSHRRWNCGFVIESFKHIECDENIPITIYNFNETLCNPQSQRILST